MCLVKKLAGRGSVTEAEEEKNFAPFLSVSVCVGIGTFTAHVKRLSYDLLHNK